MAVLSAILIAALSTFPAGVSDTSPHSEATLVSSVRAFRPGNSFLVGIRLKMDKGWHSYWKNPGDSGMPTKVAWHLPKGWKAGPLMWPVPRILGSQDVTSFGYEGEVLLLTRLTPPASASSPANLRADVQWLICNEACVPASEKVSLSLTPGKSPKPNLAWFKTLVLAEKWAPKPVAPGVASAIRKGNKILLTLKGHGSKEMVTYRFFPSDEAVLQHSASQPATKNMEEVTLALTVSEYAQSPKRLRGILVSQYQGETPGSSHGSEIDVPIYSYSPSTQEKNHDRP